MLEVSTTNEERLSTLVEFSPKAKTQEHMVSDVEKAAHLLDEVIGYRGVREPVKSMLERAYNKLRTRSKEWTRRRVRSIFNKEAKRIDYREIEEMRAVLNARNEHARYKEETARIASMGAL